MSQVSPALLEVADLRVRYRRHGQVVCAVDGVSFSVTAGQAVGIVGESGSGKSTVARSLLGLLPEGSTESVEGVVSVNGTPVAASSLEGLRGATAAMVFQDPLSYLNPLMTVSQQIGESVLLHDRSAHLNSRIYELLLQVQLPAWSLNSYPHELSGGMRQRVLLAIALACRPKLLIADEPTTALDVTTQREILALIHQLRKTLNMGLLLISHDLGVVANLCDHIHIMVAGRIIESGSIAEVFTRPRESYTRGLLKAAMSVRDEVTGRFATMQDAAVIPRPPVRPTNAAAGSQKLPAHPVLRLENVSKRFRRREGGFHQAVSAASLIVHRGETVALVGESGSGKSTLARIALGLIAPDAGEAFLNEESIYAMSAGRLRDARTDMQPVFQDAAAAFNPRRTVFQALQDASRRHSTGASAEQAAIALLENVGLVPGRDFLGRYPHELSGGQRQRASIARALAMEPSLIVADEPLSGADVSIRGQILNLFADLQCQRHLAYLFVTHDISLARAFAHRVAVMHQGVIVEQGFAEKVLTSPKHAYTQRLVEATLRVERPAELDDSALHDKSGLVVALGSTADATSMRLNAGARVLNES